MGKSTGVQDLYMYLKHFYWTRLMVITDKLTESNWQKVNYTILNINCFHLNKLRSGHNYFGFELFVVNQLKNTIDITICFERYHTVRYMFNYSIKKYKTSRLLILSFWTEAKNFGLGVNFVPWIFYN